MPQVGYPRLGGLGGAGSFGPGWRAGSADRDIGNLDLQAFDLGGNTAEFTFEGPEGNHIFYLYQNGEPIGTLDPEEIWTSDPRAASTVDFDVWAVRKNDGIPPRLIADLSGDRAFLFWDRVAATDCVKYNIYTDDGDGTVDYGTALASVENMEIGSVSLSGTGDGEIEIDGEFVGDTINATWYIRISVSGSEVTAEYNVGNGYTGTYKVLQNSPIALPNGLRAIPISDPSDYDDGDIFSFPVGPVNWYITDPLSPSGNYKFTIKAEDDAGLEGTASSELTLPIEHVLEAPSGAAATWNATTKEITITWTDPTDENVTAIHIFSNYGLLTNANGHIYYLDDWVHEENRVASAALAAESNVLDVTNGARGTYYFYVRSYDGTSYSDNYDLVEVECLDTNLADLPEAQVTEGVASGSGGVSLTFKIDISTSEPAAYNVYSGNAANWASLSTLEERVVPTFNTINDFPSSEITWTDSGHTGTVYFGIKLEDGAGLLTSGSNIVGITVDTTAPGQVTGLDGVVT